jgi:PhnB protein
LAINLRNRSTERRSRFYFTEDVDSTFKRATGWGYGNSPWKTSFMVNERMRLDPFGHHWTLMTHIEDVSPEEMKKRMAEFNAKMSSTPKKVE